MYPLKLYGCFGYKDEIKRNKSITSPHLYIMFDDSQIWELCDGVLDRKEYLAEELAWVL